MGIGDWGLGIGPNPQSPIPNPHSIYHTFIKLFNICYFTKLIYKLLIYL